MTTHQIFALATAAALSSSALAQPVPSDSPKQADQPKVFDRDVPVPNTPFLPDLTPGYVIIEGDIQIRLDEYFRLMNGGPDATFGAVTFWPNVVPFDFVTTGAGAVSAANQAAAVAAMNAISARAGLTFRPAVGAEDRIRFQNSNFNNSPVGRQGGSQIINIFNWNVQIVLCHEIYHSLGFWHEQSRSDRDTYITINTGNICGSGTSTACTAGTGPGQCCGCTNGTSCISCAFNFNINAAAGRFGPYDFDSFMHYGRTAFSCNFADTITVNAPWNAQWQSAIGQLDHFSYYDRITMRGLYPFGGDRWFDRSWGGSQGGTFFEPWNFAVASAMGLTPAGGTLFFKSGGNHGARGTYSAPITLEATNGAVVLGD